MDFLIVFMHFQEGIYTEVLCGALGLCPDYVNDCVIRNIPVEFLLHVLAVVVHFQARMYAEVLCGTLGPCPYHITHFQKGIYREVLCGALGLCPHHFDVFSKRQYTQKSSVELLV